MTFSTRLTRTRIGLVIGLILAVAVFRIVRATVLPELPNFSPVMAVAFCGGLFLPGLLAWIIPVAAVMLADLGLAWILGYEVSGLWQIVRLAGLAGAVGVGRWLARRETFGLGSFFGLLIANGLGFYFVTNAATWLVSPDYAKSLAGFIQAQTIGLPGLPPTWTFLRNALVSDLFFGALILAVRALALRSDVELAQPLHVEVRNHPRPSGGVH
jgi:hypothetical protein